MQVNSISFKALPPYLRMRPVVNANASDMAEIIKDAGAQAGYGICAKPSDVIQSNPEMFDEYKRVKPEAVEGMINEYGIQDTKTEKICCGQLRDAIMAHYQAIGGVSTQVYPPVQKEAPAEEAPAKEAPVVIWQINRDTTEEV